MTRKRNTWPQFIAAGILLTVVAAGAVYAVVAHVSRNPVAAAFLAGVVADRGLAIAHRLFGSPFTRWLPKVTIQRQPARRRPSNATPRRRSTQP